MSAEDQHPIRVLLVDDNEQMIELLTELLSNDARFIVVGSASDGQQAIIRAASDRPDVVVMDIDMPHLDGDEATRIITNTDPAIRVVALTGLVGAEPITRMIVAGAVGFAAKGAEITNLGDIIAAANRGEFYVEPERLGELFAAVTKLARTERARCDETERLNIELKDAYRATIKSLVQALRSRDEDTDSHSDRVVERVLAVGKKLALTPKQLTDLEYGALFHDIGKIALPDDILHNTTDLTAQQWSVVREHTIVGEEILRPITFLKDVAKIVRHSHENFDGSGYPDGLSGDQIPIESRIIFACDAYDAMTSPRLYQRPLNKSEAKNRMLELSSTHFDPEVVAILLSVIEAEQ